MNGWRRDLTSISVEQLNAEAVRNLKAEALSSPLRRARVLLHESLDERVHQMLIVLHRTSSIPVHRHPMQKAESYLVLEGTLAVRYFDDSGRIASTVDYVPFGQGSGPFLGRHSRSTWHQPYAKSTWAVYLETYEGPFNKEVDVEIMTHGQ